jgi:hypothetical protein
LVTPVPGAATERENGITPRSLVNCSKGSALLNGMFLVSPAGSPGARPERRPNVWSRNWPHTKPHWVTSRSEKMFCAVSLKMRLLTLRAFGPDTGWLSPSA